MKSGEDFKTGEDFKSRENSNRGRISNRRSSWTVFFKTKLGELSFNRGRTSNREKTLGELSSNRERTSNWEDFKYQAVITKLHLNNSPMALQM